GIGREPAPPTCGRRLTSTAYGTGSPPTAGKSGASLAAVGERDEAAPRVAGGGLARDGLAAGVPRSGFGCSRGARRGRARSNWRARWIVPQFFDNLVDERVKFESGISILL